MLLKNQKIRGAQNNGKKIKINKLNASAWKHVWAEPEQRA